MNQDSLNNSRSSISHHGKRQTCSATVNPDLKTRYIKIDNTSNQIYGLSRQAHVRVGVGYTFVHVQVHVHVLHVRTCSSTVSAVKYGTFFYKNTQTDASANVFVFLISILFKIKENHRVSVKFSVSSVACK